jgi:gamma-glutamyltranspeptidase/glutathione hydrolase
MPQRKGTPVDTEYIEPKRVKIPQPQRISVSKGGMVSASHYLASQIGSRVLSAGGNAIDAAVAAAFALGVCEPQASGLGGQTMMLVYISEEERLFALDGSSKAPNRALGENFRERSTRRLGLSATTIPSTPATLAYALETYGTLGLDEILAPAIELAEKGYPITEIQAKLQKREIRNFAKGNAGQIFLRNNEKPFSVGHIFAQPVLGKTLRRLAKEGVQDFYTGQIAKTISRDMAANGGLIQMDDLGQIPYPIEREPVNGRLGNLTVYTMPPPGAGRTLIEMINIIKKFPTQDRNPDSPAGALLLTETIRRAQLDRRDRPYDPNFFPQIQDERMLSNDYARLVGQQIRSRVKTSGETTHLSVMDKQGNVVSLTQSIERVYGAKVVTPSLGFLYNNYMSAFELDDITHPYYMRPNGVPWASVAPTIILRNKKPWMAIGSPGSERIASAILQVLLRLKYQSPFDAVAAPRIHCSYDGKVSLEAAYMRDDIPSELASRGFEIDVREPMSFYLGCIQLVLKESEDFIGVADPRRDGAAAGPKN